MSSESWLLVKKTHGWRARLISIYSWYNLLYGCAGVCQQELLLWEGSMWMDGPGDGHLEMKQTLSPQLSLQLKVLSEGDLSPHPPSLPPPFLLFLFFLLLLLLFLSFSIWWREQKCVSFIFSFSLCLKHPHSDLYADDRLFLLGSGCKASSHQAKLLHLCSVNFEEEAALCGSVDLKRVLQLTHPAASEPVPELCHLLTPSCLVCLQLLLFLVLWVVISHLVSSRISLNFLMPWSLSFLGAITVTILFLK